MPIAFDVVNQTFVEVYVIPFSNYPHILTHYIKLILIHENFDLITNLHTYVHKLIKCFETYKIKLQEQHLPINKAR